MCHCWNFSGKRLLATLYADGQAALQTFYPNYFKGLAPILEEEYDGELSPVESTDYVDGMLAHIENMKAFRCC